MQSTSSADRTTTLTIRIPVDLKKQVTEAAKRDDRSITSFVVKVLRTSVDMGRRGGAR